MAWSKIIKTITNFDNPDITQGINTEKTFCLRQQVS